MRPSRDLALLAVGLCAAGHASRAQQPAIPVRLISSVRATSVDTMAAGMVVRPLGDGRLLVNDVYRKRLLMLDPTLKRGTVLADTTAATEHAYGTGLSGMIPFQGDSTLVLDVASGAFAVIDPAGRFARILPAPKTVANVVVQNGGPNGFDHAGGLLFRVGPRSVYPQVPSNFNGDTTFLEPGGTVVRRVNVASWRSDTIVTLTGPPGRNYVSGKAATASRRMASSPLNFADDIAVMHDGTLAVVRAADYHVDWIGPNGRPISTAPIRTDWLPISAAGKRAIIDSIRMRDSLEDALQIASAVARGEAPPNFQRAYVLPTDLPDAWPPFVSGRAQVDAEDHLWVLIRRGTLETGSIYDIINRAGARVERVQLPPASGLVALGPGIVYVAAAVDTKSYLLARLVAMPIR